MSHPRGTTPTYSRSHTYIHTHTHTHKRPCCVVLVDFSLRPNINLVIKPKSCDLNMSETKRDFASFFVKVPAEADDRITKHPTHWFKHRAIIGLKKLGVTIPKETVSNLFVRLRALPGESDKTMLILSGSAAASVRSILVGKGIPLEDDRSTREAFVGPIL